MVNKKDLSYVLIWTSTIIGGVGLVLFVMSAMFVNHANGWLLVLVGAPILVLICAIGLIVGLLLRKMKSR